MLYYLDNESWMIQAFDISLGLLLISVKSYQDGTKVRVLDVSKYSSTKEQLLFIRGMQWEDEIYVDCFIDTFSCISHPLWAMLVDPSFASMQDGIIESP